MRTVVSTVSAVVVLSVAALTAQAPSSTESLRGIVKSYLQVHAALTQDKLDDVKGPAGTIASQAATLGKDGAELAKAASAFAAAKDLKTARDAFGPLSDALIARVKADGSPDLASDLRVGFCPMNRKSWIQREEQTKNPYFGPAMSTCGSVTPIAAAK